jgi:hypothetical protein
MLFSLRRKLDKDLGNENSIVADKILLKHEKIVESFHRSGLLDAVEELIVVQDWFDNYFENQKDFTKDEKLRFIFKSNVIVSTGKLKF